MGTAGKFPIPPSLSYPEELSKEVGFVSMTMLPSPFLLLSRSPAPPNRQTIVFSPVLERALYVVATCWRHRTQNL